MGLWVDPWMWSLGLAVLVLTVLFSSLCLHCGRRSFELRDTAQEKSPSALVRVVKLEEVGDEPVVKSKENQENIFITPWRNHLGTPDSGSEVPVWRNHLELTGAP